jgi:predicted transglutaminase-like cysteine proteinase
MVHFRSAAGTGRIVACVLALLLGATSALAQSTSEPAGPARFFRIQDVLSKIESGRKPSGDDSVRLAARSGDILSDVPLRGSIPQIGEEPFGLFAFRAPEGILWRKWRGVASDIAGETVVIGRCRDNTEDCTPAARRYLAILEAVKTREGRTRLEEVNRHINAAIRYVSDMAQHGEPDRWTAPLAALAAGKGDCEDYAIAKFVILRESGFPLADLRFLLVRDKLARDDHAVLAARLEGQWLILDNRFLRIPEDREMHNFTPLFALDHEGVKLVAAPYAKVPIVVDADTKPAALFESEGFSLRGAVAEEIAGQAPAPDQAAGASSWTVAPLLM